MAKTRVGVRPRPTPLVPTSLGFNYGYEFDGVNEGINISGSLGLTTDDSFSISYWYKRPIATSFSEVQFGQYSTTSNSTLKLAGYGAYPSILIIADDNTRVDARGTVRYDGFNEWVHVIWTKNTGTDRSDLTLYVNGVLQSITAVYQNNLNSGQNITCDNLFIGGQIAGIGSPDYFTGTLDDIQFYNFELNATQVNDIYNNGYVTAPTLGPIHHWKLGEDDTFSTDWTVNDSVGSLNGTSVNMEEEDRNMGVAYSMDFNDGVSNEYIDFGNVLDKDGSSAFTLSFWTWGDTASIPASYTNLFGKSAGGIGVQGWSITCNGGETLTLYLDDGAGGRCWSYPSVYHNMGTGWNHWVVIYNGDKDASTMKWIVNGVLDTTIVVYNTMIGSSSNTDDFVIGKSGSNYPSFKMMNLSIYNSALTIPEGKLLYNNGVPVLSSVVGLTAAGEWELGGEEDTATTIIDKSGNGVDGTLINMDLTNKTSDTP